MNIDNVTVSVVWIVLGLLSIALLASAAAKILGAKKRLDWSIRRVKAYQPKFDRVNEQISSLPQKGK